MRVRTLRVKQSPREHGDPQMCRKIVVTTLVVGLGGWLALRALFGPDWKSYAHTWWGNMRQSAQQQVPVRFELDRLNDKIAALRPEFEKNLQKIAKEEVELDRLRRQIANLDKRLAASKQRLLSQAAALEADSASAVGISSGGGSAATRSTVARQLAEHQADRRQRDSLSQMVAVREKRLAALTEKLNTLVKRRREWQIEAKELAARLDLVEVAESANRLDYDDSEAARIEALRDDIAARLAAREKLAAAGNLLERGLPATTEAAEPTDVARRVREYFKQPAGQLAAGN